MSLLDFGSQTYEQRLERGVSLTIKTFQMSDSEAVCRLWNECLVVHQSWNEPTETIARQQAQQPDGFFVGKLDDQVVATCIAGYDGVRGWLYRVVVSPAHRRSGVGRQLVERAEEYLRQLGCVKVNLQVLGENEPGVQFWQSNEYHEQDRVSMAKLLAPLRSDVPENAVLNTVFSIGNGVQLTSLRLADKPYLCSILNGTEIYARYTSLSYPYLESHADQWLRKCCPLASAQIAADLVWAIRDDHECLIGAIGLHSVRPGHDAQLGYWLSTAWWGRGVATQAVEQVCSFAFGQLGLVRIAAEVVPGNVASVRVLEKNGFQKEGVLRQARRYRDSYSDLLTFSRVDVRPR